MGPGTMGTIRQSEVEAMGKRAKWIGLALVVGLGGVLVACGAMDSGTATDGGMRGLAAVSPLSRTIQLSWDNYEVVTYTGLITDVPRTVPMLRVGARLILGEEEIYFRMVQPGLSAEVVTGTGLYGDPIIFHYPDFYGAAEEWVGCWWEGEGWPTISCNPIEDFEEDEEGYALYGEVEPRPMWELYMPVFKFPAGGG